MNTVNNFKPERIIGLLKKLKSDKKSLFIIILSFAGVFLILLSEVLPSEKTESDNYSLQQTNTESDAEESLERIIGKLKGVGRVEVMVVYEGTSETVYASDKNEYSKDTEIKTEQKHVIIDKGSSDEGLRLKELYPRVIGVAVVCEGGGNPTVKNEITQMIKALFNISSNNISISEMNG